jgi:NAD(P)-dependent dehydrogenase (short-subunit alcohol dehydrogenase family)
VVQSVLDRHGDIDILVNNVGGGDATDLRDFFDYDDDLWRKTFDLNFFTAVRTCRAAMPSVIRRRGLVVNISSLGARMPHTGPVPTPPPRPLSPHSAKPWPRNAVSRASALSPSHPDRLAPRSGPTRTDSAAP